MKTLFQEPRSVKRYVQSPSGHLLAGTLHPACAVQFGQSEGGYVEQSIDQVLEPIAGRMLTAISAEVHAIFVPMPAIYALENEDEEFPFNSDVYRERLLAAETLIDTEAEGEVSKNLDVTPRSVSGTKVVGKQARLAYLAAVNYLRQMTYYKATLLDATETAIAPALFSQSLLDRYSGVLNPEDNVNGSVQLSIGDMQLPVTGVGRLSANAPPNGNDVVVENRPGDEVQTYEYVTRDNDGIRLESNASGIPQVFAHLDGAEAGNVSLKDFARTERMDALTRVIDGLVKSHPLHGQAAALRFAYGLNIDNDNRPYSLYHKRQIFGSRLKTAMDGDNLDKEVTDHSLGFRFTVPVPRTEFGGVVVTLISVKPDEVLESMPNPVLSKPIVKKNYLSDEAVIDPVAVTVRDLDADCDQVDEETRSMYVGNNHLEMNYQTHGFTRATDMTEVANKSAVWSVSLPTSVTADNINYQLPVPIYPFVLNDDDDPVSHYRVTSVARIMTPLLRGPTPIEEMEIIEDEALFEAFEEVVE